MSAQEEGILGSLVGGMIRRSTRARLRNLWWTRPEAELNAPVIFYANHHGWLDGYVMYHAMRALNLRFLDWIEEFDSFPLFGKVGGMRFASGDLSGRAQTVRRTIRLMRSEKRSLVLFAEGVLHRPPEIWPLGKSLELVAKKVAGVQLVPAAIYYEQSMHERPEAWISLGEAHSFVSLEDCHGRLGSQLESLRNQVATGRQFDLLAAGTPSVNERMSLKRFQAK